MLKGFIQTEDDIKFFILRFTVGFIVLAHGFQKLFGWFGGHGLSSTIEAFAQWFGFPAFITFLVVMSDSFGAFFLILGFLTRFMAASISMVMVGAIIFVHGRWGFYMNWYSEQRGEGFEFHLLILAICVVLIIAGGGKWSADKLIYNKLIGGK